MVYDASKSSQADPPFSNMFMTVGVGTEGGLGIIGVNGTNPFHAKGASCLLQCPGQSLLRVDRIPGFKAVSRVQAYAQR